MDQLVLANSCCSKQCVVDLTYLFWSEESVKQSTVESIELVQQVPVWGLTAVEPIVRLLGLKVFLGLAFTVAAAVFNGFSIWTCCVVYSSLRGVG